MGGAVAMMILLVFQTKGQIRPTTLIIIGISMQTLFYCACQGLLITTKQLSAAKAYTWLVGVFTVLRLRIQSFWVWLF